MSDIDINTAILERPVLATALVCQRGYEGSSQMVSLAVQDSAIQFYINLSA